jgi:hypothetical protein
MFSRSWIKTQTGRPLLDYNPSLWCESRDGAKFVAAIER